MKKTLLTIIAVTIGAALGAQNYYAVKKANYKAPGYDITKISATSGTTTLLTKPSNDLLSTTQTIPFGFNFYGNAVTQYKISDNGYLTFDLDSTKSEAPQLLPLPTAGSINNTIYAFWSNFEFKSAPNANFIVKAMSYTTGTTPNRVHHIQWFGVSISGAAIAANADVYSFAISLHEGATGVIDLTYNAGFGSAAAAGAIGVENSDGTKAKMIGDVISNYKGGGTSDNVYQFVYGTQPTFDIALLNTTLADIYKVGTSVAIQSEVANYGNTAVTSLKFNYTVNNGPTQTSDITSLNLMANGESKVSVETTIPWVAATAGSKNDFKVWISAPNGLVDGDSTNNVINKNAVLVNNGTTVANKVLFEEATGAWCQHCPDAHTYVAEMEKTFGDDLVVAIHHNSDAMTNAESDKINAAYANGYPNGFINRTPFNVGGTVSVGLSRTVWNNATTTAKTFGAPVKVNITNVTFANGKIDFTVEAEFSDYYAGDLRIGAMIKEDLIRGVGSQQYDQIIASQYTSDPSHPLYQKKNPMVGYNHKSVVINIPSGAWGSANSVPTSVTPGQKVTANYSYTLPAITRPTIPTNADFLPTGVIDGRNKPANMWLIGFVAQYDADNANNRRILNVNERQMWNKAADVTTADLVQNTFTLVPNTADRHVEIALNYSNPSAQDALVTITNTAGQTIGTYNMNELKTGMNTLKIATQDFANGIYLVNISGANLNLTQKLVIAH